MDPWSWLWLWFQERKVRRKHRNMSSSYAVLQEGVESTSNNSHRYRHSSYIVRWSTTRTWRTWPPSLAQRLERISSQELHHYCRNRGLGLHQQYSQQRILCVRQKHAGTSQPTATPSPRPSCTLKTASLKTSSVCTGIPSQRQPAPKSSCASLPLL